MRPVIKLPLGRRAVGEFLDVVQRVHAHEVLAKQPTVTKLVQRMTDQGWVTPLADPADQRRTLVTTSSAGRRLVRPLLEKARAQEAEMLRALAAPEQEALKALCLLDSVVDDVHHLVDDTLTFDIVATGPVVGRAGTFADDAALVHLERARPSGHLRAAHVRFGRPDRRRP